MGSSGSKPRRGRKPQHLPKVGSREALREEQHLERRAVLGNMGLHPERGGWTKIVAWVVIVALVFSLIGAGIAWLF